MTTVPSDGASVVDICGREHLHRRSHRPRGDQHLRQEVLAAFEPTANLLEGRDQRLEQQDGRADAETQARLDLGDGGLRFAPEDVLVEGVEDHGLARLGHLLATGYIP